MIANGLACWGQTGFFGIVFFSTFSVYGSRGDDMNCRVRRAIAGIRSLDSDASGALVLLYPNTLLSTPRCLHAYFANSQDSSFPSTLPQQLTSASPPIHPAPASRHPPISVLSRRSQPHPKLHSEAWLAFNPQLPSPPTLYSIHRWPEVIGGRAFLRQHLPHHQSTNHPTTTPRNLHCPANKSAL